MSIVLALFACGGEPPKPPPAPEPPPAPAKPPEPPKHAALFGPVPADYWNGKAPKKELVDLGRDLFNDARLSAGGEVSCNSCHGLDTYGVDNKPTSTGIKGQLGGRNSPTVYNAGGHFAQFWDGRAANLEEQAKGPILNPVEMGMASAEAVVAELEKLGYGPAFEAAFGPGPITFDNFAKAVAAFEGGLVTRDSAFDKYLAGDAAALSADQAAGLDLFVETGCNSCHSGALLGGGMYQKLGVVVPWETKDAGRMDVTKNEADKGFFKVPSLRNVAKTGPYLHDGSVATLDEMVAKMAKHQLGKDLGPKQVEKIVAFLDSLTGVLPTEYVAGAGGKGGKAKADDEGKAGKGKADEGKAGKGKADEGKAGKGH